MRRSWLVAASTLILGSALGSAAASAQTPIGAVTPMPAHSGSGTGAVVYDPWERINRKVFAFNTVLDRVVLRPGVVFYHHVLPHPIRNGIHNAVTNATGPIIFVNDVLQLRPKKAVVTATRFVVNSTVGFAGFADVANDGLQLPYHSADFGQTLGRYGVAQGPYLYLPVLGPSTLRDGAGRIVDGFADPLNVINYDGRASLAVARVVAGGVDARDRADPILKDINKTATDPYAFIRSGYLQMRHAAVNGETNVQDVKALPDFGPEPGGSATPSAAIAPRAELDPAGLPADATTPTT